MNRIATYKNGNTWTTIYDDGTKEHFTLDDEFEFAFSESCDVQISQCCDNGCEWCYYGCSPTGKHGKLTGWKFYDSMRPYTEIAINIQYPIHPLLISFLKDMKKRKIIVNATINQNHFMSDSYTYPGTNERLIYGLVKRGLVKGIGISLTDPRQDRFIEAVKLYPNAVIHVIAGVTRPEDINCLMGHDLKLLILGYKTTGRGMQYHFDNYTYINDNIEWLESSIGDILNGFKVVSFDNLAIKQLHIKDKLSKKEWENFYGGDDGTVTFFIDLVKGVFARSSLSQITYPIGDKTMDEMFEVIKKEAASGK